MIPPFEVKAPYLALLGDIGRPSDPVYCSFLLEQANRFQKVFVLPGNHEYYKSSIQDAKIDLAKACAQHPNLLQLDRTSMVIDGVRIVGATFWQRIVNAKWAIEHMNDFGMTKFNENKDGKLVVRQFNTADMNTLHDADGAFLVTEVQAAKSAGQQCVVMTHHPPDATFAAQLYGKACVWCYGHTHHSSNDVTKATRVVSNQLGYVTLGSLTESGYWAECVVQVYANGSSDVLYSDTEAERKAIAAKAEQDIANNLEAPDAPPPPPG